MKYRLLGRTGFEISDVSFGAWAIGGTWGSVDARSRLPAVEAFCSAALKPKWKSSLSIRTLAGRCSLVIRMGLT